MAENLAKDLGHDASVAGDIYTQFSKKICRNLCIALTGPIGSRTGNVKEQLKIALRDVGYKHIYVIKLSEKFDPLLKRFPGVVLPKIENDPKHPHSDFYLQYREKQEKGNLLRSKTNESSILAHIAIQEISVQRSIHGQGLATAEDLKNKKDDEFYQGLAAEEKIAFIIDQLKRPEEVKLLRRVYKELFYLCAVVETTENRISNLTGHGTTIEEAEELIKIDKAESENKDSGQQVSKTVLEADYFLNNNNVDDNEIRKRVARFLDLVHGQHGIPPTQEEFGMFQAHSAGLGSLCLSRQVGAAILDKDGNLLSVGRNDVPKFGGGLYENVGLGNNKDKRCVFYDTFECHNDKHKNKLKRSIFDQISALGIADDVAEKVLKIVDDSKIKDLVEFSRSIHAEMDAIISLTRKGVRLNRECTLYTTTFPCHMCARHIITAGVEKVIYIEPYEKSLAIELHQDSITTKKAIIDEETKLPTQVEIRSFHGVAPRKYRLFFHSHGERKNDNGVAIKLGQDELIPLDASFFVSFFQLESKCIQDLGSKIPT